MEMLVNINFKSEIFLHLIVSERNEKINIDVGVIIGVQRPTRGDRSCVIAATKAPYEWMQDIIIYNGERDGGRGGGECEEDVRSHTLKLK